jgi:hypothetical protein
MTFTKRLRTPIIRGDITCSVRIWRRPHVKVGGRYRLGEGWIEVTSIRRITLADVTSDLARRSGFLGVCRPSEGGEAWTRRERLPDRLRIPLRRDRRTGEASGRVRDLRNLRHHRAISLRRDRSRCRRSLIDFRKRGAVLSAGLSLNLSDARRRTCRLPMDSPSGLETTRGVYGRC